MALGIAEREHASSCDWQARFQVILAGARPARCAECACCFMIISGYCFRDIEGNHLFPPLTGEAGVIGAGKPVCGKVAAAGLELACPVPVGFREKASGRVRVVVLLNVGGFGRPTGVKRLVPSLILCLSALQ